MRRIATSDDIEAGLDALCALDARLLPVRAAVGEVELRLAEPGFASLVSIVVSQQVSRASADAILGRLVRLVDPLTPQELLAAGDDLFREAGLSRPKQRAVLALARALSDGLDLDAVRNAETEAAIATLTAVPGIGPWTAQCYLLFAAGHPDVFPDRDVALQTAVGHALGISPRPPHRALAEIAARWSPWRGVAARLFWAYYRGIRGLEGAPPSTLGQKE